MRSAEPILDLVRWRNASLAGLGVVIGSWWAITAPPAEPTTALWSVHASEVLAAVVAAIALTAFANATNDWADAELDRAAHPERPLPSGRLTRAAALRVAMFAALLSIAASAFAHVALVLCTVAVLVLMLAYNGWLKRLGIAGHLLVAFLASLPFLYGAWSVGRPRAALLLIAFAVPLHLAREVAKALDDAPADAGRRRTVPLAWGARTARAVVVGALVSFALVLIPLAVRRPPFAAAMIPALACCAAGASRTVRGRSGAPGLLKTAMVGAMAALLFAR